MRFIFSSPHKCRISLALDDQGEIVPRRGMTIICALVFKPTASIIQDNKSKGPKYGTPEDCITGILENSKQLQAIIKKDWEKLEQLNKKQHD
jgi:hypothetical protein